MGNKKLNKQIKSGKKETQRETKKKWMNKKKFHARIKADQVFKNRMWVFKLIVISVACALNSTL